MTTDRVEVMAGEPWCFDPEQIRRLTDWQIEELYLKPAVRKSEAMERDRKGLPPAAPPEEEAKPMATPPPRAAMVGVMTGMMGMSVKDANAEYDRQLAEWEKQKARG